MSSLHRSLKNFPSHCAFLNTHTHTNGALSVALEIILTSLCVLKSDLTKLGKLVHFSQQCRSTATAFCECGLSSGWRSERTPRASSLHHPSSYQFWWSIKKKKTKNFTSSEKCSFKSLSWMTECWAIYMISCARTHTQIFSWGPFGSSNNELWRIKVLLLVATGAQTFIHFVSICCHTLLPLCRINKGHYWCPQSSLCSLAIYLGLLGIPGGGDGRGETIWRQFLMCHFRFFRGGEKPWDW